MVAAHHDSMTGRARHTELPGALTHACRDAPEQAAGTPSTRMLVRGYVAAMFDKFLHERTDPVLARPIIEPEVTTIR